MSEAWTSARLGLPLLASGQAAKETTHNEALTVLEMLVQAAVEGVADAPPADPAPGACWIVGAGAGGDWAGRAGAIAMWTAGGWRFAAPRAGTEVAVPSTGARLRRDDAGWRVAPVAAAALLVDGVPVVGARQPGIAEPAGGAVIDTGARVAIGQLLTALRTHGLIEPEA